MQTSMSVQVGRPIKEVFDHTIHNVSEWSTIVVKDEVIKETPEGVGTTFRVTTEENGRRMEFDGLVTPVLGAKKSAALYAALRRFDEAGALGEVGGLLEKD